MDTLSNIVGEYYWTFYTLDFISPDIPSSSSLWYEVLMKMVFWLDNVMKLFPLQWAWNVFGILYIHMYTIDHCNHLVRTIYDLASYNANVVCVNFIYKWLNRQPKVDCERQIFWKTFHGNFIYSQNCCQKSYFRLMYIHTQLVITILQSELLT